MVMHKNVAPGTHLMIIYIVTTNISLPDPTHVASADRRNDHQESFAVNPAMPLG
jgi:hypothetical protein